MLILDSYINEKIKKKLMKCNVNQKKYIRVLSNKSRVALALFSFFPPFIVV